ncbi:MAG TPA: divergent polysaccharide deacetylase family protein [Stellaceae bacterium]|jgi:polysaccharide deacetylase 2 family uncharacterized protein YibQ|nr:divergent polysaccharide deacetylase family protein [Stellaceae bacterium]
MRAIAILGLVAAVILGGAAWFLMRGPGSPPAPVQRVVVALPPAGHGAAPAMLLPAPDPGLVETTPDGALPIIGKDGREPWQAYARPFDGSDKRPRLALIVTGLGLDHALSEAAADRLPAAVTLSFDPYAENVKDAIDQARSLGHETLLGLPLEPLDYPREDPGPLTLLAALPAGENATRLNTLMAKASGYVGLVALWGGRFTTEKAAVLSVFETLKRRGLLFVDDKPPAENATALLAAQIKLPWAAANRMIDIDTAPAAIDQALADLEADAQRGGAALAIAALSPALVDHAASWAAGLDKKGLALAPASAVANRQSTIPPSPQP